MNLKKINLLIVYILIGGTSILIKSSEVTELPLDLSGGLGDFEYMSPRSEEDKSLERMCNEKVTDKGLESIVFNTERKRNVSLFVEYLKDASQKSKNILLRRYAYHGDLLMINCLLQNQADPLDKSNKGWSALLVASYKKDRKVLQLILGENPDDIFIEQALKTARESKDDSLLQLFLQKRQEKIVAEAQK